MFAFLKNFVRKAVGRPVRNHEPVTQTATTATQRAVPPAHKVSPLHKNGNGSHPNAEGISLPVQSILGTWQVELQPRLKNADVGDLTITVALEKILAQLSHGTVKIPFGELRQAAPHAFSVENDRDAVLVPVPLAEVLARLNPALITRRRVQKKVEVPVGISSPFDASGQGLIFSIGPTKPEPASAPLRQTKPSPPAAPAAPVRGSMTSAPTPPPPSATPSAAPAIIPASRVLRELSTNKSSPAPGMTPQPIKPVADLPGLPKVIGDLPKPVSDGLKLSMAQTAPVAEPAKPANPPPKPAGNGDSLTIGLTSLAEAWPEGVRKEIVELNLVDAKVAVPTEAVGQALKQGRIAFTWQALRGWIKPAPVPSASAHDSLVLELPLRVVAPLFLAHQKEANKAQQKVAVDVEIPNLFFGFPQPDADSTASASTSSAVAKPTDSNYYVWDDTSDTAIVDVAATKRPSPGTSFVAKYATPNEVVSRASSL